MTTPSQARPARVVPVTPEPTNRLTFDDEVFLRSETVLGTRTIGQNVWRMAGRVPVEDVEALARTLATGPFGRAVLRSRVPAARARWVRSSVVPAVRVRAGELAPGDVTGWLAETCETRLDPFTGPLWGLFMASTTGGDTLVVLNVSHVMADGGLKLDSVAAAVEGTPVPRLPVDDLAQAQVTLRDDLADGRRMLTAAARGVAAAVRQKAAPAPPEVQTAERRPVPAAQPDDDVVHEIPFVGIDSPAEEWRAVATDAGGTANGLLVALSVEMLLEAGIAEAGRPVKVALPVSLRGAGDWRSNVTSGVSIVVDTEVRAGAGRVTDLGHIRSRSKAAFAALYDGTRVDPTAPLRPVLQAIPDRAAKAIAGTLTSPLCLASNLGRQTPAFSAPFGVPCEAILFRAAVTGPTRGALRRQRGGLATWWGETGETCTFAASGLDPDAVPDAARLAEIARAVYARWGLTPTFW